jgi:hypothetical protein
MSRPNGWCWWTMTTSRAKSAGTLRPIAENRDRSDGRVVALVPYGMTNDTEAGLAEAAYRG